jgi:phage terminase large subunit-like protein
MDKLLFVPIEGARYNFDYEKIVAEINTLVDGESRRFLQFMRFWCQEDLFFLLYFILRVPVNHPWVVDRITEVQNCNDGTLDLWAREHWKALSTDTPILTVNEGWKNHIDLEPGDLVYGLDGLPVKVVANTGIMEGAQCRRINFHDGYLIASSEHEWLVRRKVRARVAGGYGDQRDTYYVDTIKTTDNLPVKDWNYLIPRTPILRTESQLLQLDPYVLGVWLGDGTAAKGEITSADPEIFESFRMAGFTCIESTTGPYGYRIGGLKGILKLMDLLGNKHIPYRYLVGSPAQRLALLQGLMDTDGSCNTRGTAEFTNTNESLVNGVYSLAASLGMQPHLNKFESKNTGRYKPTFQVSFQAYKSMPPFRLKRKLDRCKDGERINKGRYINSVDEIESCPVNCIQVDSPDGIYLAGYNLVPTHNSTIMTYGLNIQEVLKDPNTRIGIFSHTRAIAKSFLRRIKHTLESNELLKALFPDILYQNPITQAPKWSEDEGLVVNRPSVFQECTFEAWGIVDGMPVSKHFSVLNYDDIVVRESVSTPEQIEKVDECFRLSLNLGSYGGKKRVIGTTYHFADQYEKLKDQGGWVVRIHPAEDANGNPVLLSPEILAEKRRQLGPYVYNCQMLLNPVAKEDQRFRMEWLQFYRTLPKQLTLFLLCDPANTKKYKATGGDYTVYFLWGLDSSGNKFLVDVVRDRLTLTERWVYLKRMVGKHRNIQKIGYEQYGMAADIQHFQEMMAKEGVYFTIYELGGNKLSKEDRIARLIPEFEGGKIWLPEHLEYNQKDGKTVDLVKVFIDEEYLSYPFSKHDDMLDAASRIKDEMFGAFTPYDEAEEWEEEEYFQPRMAAASGRSAVTGY